MGDLSPAPLSRPQPLADHHRLEAFDSGEAGLNSWLQRRARANQATGASRTYVACRGDEVVAYYALATGGVDLINAPGRYRRNMPDPIPAVVLARLAVDRRDQSRGIGRAMLRDAMARVVLASESIGIALVLVHAPDQDARRFYLHFGFRESPLAPLVLMTRVKDVREGFDDMRGL